MATVWICAINFFFIKSKNGHYITLLCFNFGFVDNAGGCPVFLLVSKNIGTINIVILDFHLILLIRIFKSLQYH